MKRTNIYLSEEQLEALRRLAERRGEPVAQLVREALDEWLASQNVRPIREDEWSRRFGDVLTRRKELADERGWTEKQVERDVMAAVREVRKARAARRR
jgi:hypothetical protein